MKIQFIHNYNCCQINNKNTNVSILSNNHQQTVENSELPLYAFKHNIINRVTFCAKHLDLAHEIKNLNKIDFPSKEYRRDLLEYIRVATKHNRKISIINFQKRYYSRKLLNNSNVKTLDGAKNICPEFKDVIDEKTFDINSLARNNIIRKIAEGKVQGLSIDNLSLKLLQMIYCNGESVDAIANKFGLTLGTMNKILDLLNIQLNKKYNRVLTSERQSIVKTLPIGETRREKLRAERQEKKRIEAEKKILSPSSLALIDKIKNIKKLPPQLKSYLLKELSNPYNNKSLYNLHNEYYSQLLSCNTLEEAKELYPDLKNVKSEKDLKIKRSTNGLNLFQRIKDGHYDRLNFDNLGLEFLKRYIAELMPVNKLSEHYNIQPPIANKILLEYRIFLPKEYIRLVNNSQKHNV